MKYECLITGTNGFIGKNLKKRLETMYFIHEINEDIFNNLDWKNTLINKLHEIKPNVVFHVGACSDTLNQDANYMMERNFEFSKVLSDYCSMDFIPLIYSSSAANYGVNGDYPSNLYGWSKYTAEQYITQNGGIALRYFNVYGHGEEHKGRMASFIYQMIDKKQNNIKPKLFPNNPKRDFVYVEDVVEANIHAFNDHEEFAYKYFDVGYGESRSFEDILYILKMDYDYFDVNDIPKGYQFFTQSKKEKWMPKWTPIYNLEDGIDDYLNKLNISI